MKLWKDRSFWEKVLVLITFGFKLLWEKKE